jgi:hypothetical protein
MSSLIWNKCIHFFVSFKVLQATESLKWQEMEWEYIFTAQTPEMFRYGVTGVSEQGILFAARKRLDHILY